MSAPQLCKELSISQSTLSRAIKELGQDIVRMGLEKRPVYAMKRNIAEVGDSCPVFSVSNSGQLKHALDLIPIKPRSFWVNSHSNKYESRHYTDLPYWLNDYRPSGYLGRLIPKRYPEFSFPADIRLWSAESCIRFWCALGADLPENLIFGQQAAALLAKSKEINKVDHH